jgi:DNA mismatch repair protein MutS
MRTLLAEIKRPLKVLLAHEGERGRAIDLRRVAAINTLASLDLKPPKSSAAPTDLPSASSSALTPMKRQYQRIKDSLPPDVLLFFRLGDFYELFGQDAIEASALLNVTLTKRQETPMCGVPFHSAQHYIRKLIRGGRRVAVCDQKGEVRAGQLVEREITEVLSAGTVTDPQLLDAGRNQYLAAAFHAKGVYGFAYLDLTTGTFRVTEVTGGPALLDELTRVSPAEFLISDDAAQALAFADLEHTRPYDAHAFLAEQAEFTLREHFRVQSLDGFGCARLPLAVAAAGAIFHYLRQELRRSLDHVTALSSYQPGDFLVLDAVSQTHLEIVRSRGEGGTSLLQALDRTVTALGARQLRNWLLHPLRKLAELEERQQLIADLLAAPDSLRNLRETLREVRDLERSLGRLSQANGSARDLAALRDSLQAVPALQRLLADLPPAGGQPGSLQGKLAQRLQALPDLVEILARAIAAEPPATWKEAGMFRDGYHPELDELRQASTEGQNWIAALQEREIERTGIKSLKIRFNSVFGYYIEITKSNLAAVPDHYRRKQTTAGGERFYTPELKEVENRIIGAQERAQQLEQQLFFQLRELVLRQAASVQQTAAAIGALDALGSLAETARQYNYCRPGLHPPGAIFIREGRHPVLDQRTGADKFVPNDVDLDNVENRLIVLTGPNMAGKSTYLRQVALLVLMAQIGSYVPAAQAEIGLVDRIFTRVGANDDLARGQSTFLVEMNETANIIHHATADSLVILDEVGRGTSTYDGLSIAWSVAEHLHDRIGALTLFATHYHELTELAKTHAAAKNFTVAVREWNDEIVFLHRIVAGAADRSYGIQVARLAGLPAEIIGRAKEILGRLEAGASTAEVFEPSPKSALKSQKPRTREDATLTFDW